MSALENLCNIVIDESFTPEMEELGRCAKVELTQLFDVKNEAQKHLKLIEANYDALQTPMPCGHLARYAVNDKDGTQYCCMCVLEAVTGTTDPKIQAKIAEIINHD